MPRPKLTLTTCTEQLGGESDHGQGSAVPEAQQGLDDTSPPEPPGLLRALEKVTLSGEEVPSRRRLPPPLMPWRGTQLVPERQGGRLVLRAVTAKNPFALHASRADGRFRLTRVPPFNGLDEISVCSNGKKDSGGDESGGNR